MVFCTSNKTCHRIWSRLWTLTAVWNCLMCSQLEKEGSDCIGFRVPNYCSDLQRAGDPGFRMMPLRLKVTTVCGVFRRVVLKCFSRHQASSTLSSCEADLVAIQAAVQEAIRLRSLSFVLHRIQVYSLSRSEETSLDVVCPILFWTDSLSGKMLLEGADLQRMSRHIDIKNQGKLVERTFVCWVLGFNPRQRGRASSMRAMWL